MIKSKSHPFFSIIIPAYNLEKYIRKTLFSIVNQSFNDYEVIIIDDGSTDKTSLICNNVLISTNIRHTILNQPNQGVSIARNNGLDIAQGKYILFLDGDDYLENDFLKEFYNYFQKYKADISFCRYNKVSEQYRIIPTRKIVPNRIKKLNNSRFILNKFIMSNDIMLVGTAIYKKKLLIENNIKFSSNLSYGEDQEFTAKAIYYSENIGFINKYLVNYLQRKSGAVGSFKIHKVRDNIKAYANLRRLFLRFNDSKNRRLIEEFKIPYVIFSTVKKYAIRNYSYEFNRIISKKTLRSYLLKGLFGKNSELKLRLKILFLFLLPNKLFKLLFKKLS